MTKLYSQLRLVARRAAGERFGRLRGKSDLLHVGSTAKGRRTIRNRRKDHLSAKEIGRKVGHRLGRVQGDLGQGEALWKPFDAHGGAKEDERALLGS